MRVGGNGRALSEPGTRHPGPMMLALVTREGRDAIRVSVRIAGRTKCLSLIGINSFTCTGTAIASLVTGVTGPS
jgi:hypothetical protein